jgi:flavin reductase (DIM6/NTAB) family NADH-FMN oxidoreductase RutF
MISYSTKEIQELPHLNKINLINSATGYKSANLIGTKSLDGITNLAIFSSVTHYGSAPPIFGFVVRPTTVRRNTYTNIKNTEFFTINPIRESDIEEAHHTSAKYPSDISEFDRTHFEEEYKDGFYAPFIKGAPIQIGLKIIEEHCIKANNTILVLGEVVKLYVDESLIENDLFINLSKAKIATINGLDGYTIPTNPKRLPYQRPK